MRALGLGTTHVRKLLLFVIAAIMLVGGLYLLVGELFVARIIHFQYVIGGATLATLGGYLLWVDFVAPLLGIETTED